jgi:PAS domain S-box-containing protein
MKDCVAASRPPEVALQLDQLLLDTIPVPVFIKGASGVYVGCNTAYEAFLGIRREQFIGRTVYDVAPPDLAAIYHARDLELFAHPGTQVYEAQVTDRHGQAHDVVFHKATFSAPDGTTAGLVGVVHDVTERKRAEQELRESEARYRDALSQIKTLKGLLPVCAACKKIRDDSGYWTQMEAYIRDHSEVEFSHAICPECARRLYRDFL